ncbi:MAG: hypothetical protein HKO06_11750 [Pseudomonadales bacterium]|nr:hypothetical protein [Pseudomonadales bacterium]
MQLNLIRALLGLLLLIFSLTMLLPLGFAFYYREETLAAFLLAFTITAATGK